MGPLLWRDGYTLYFPGNPDKGIVPNYYESDLKATDEKTDTDTLGSVTEGQQSTLASPEIEPLKGDGKTAENDAQCADEKLAEKHQKELQALDSLPWAHPKRIYATLKLVFTYGITRDIIHHQSKGLEDIHRRAPQFDNKVEHLWTTAQVCSAMVRSIPTLWISILTTQIMSISHGANDISNAIGPFTTEYMTWHTGVASAKTDTPIWIKAVGGLGLGVGKSLLHPIECLY
jgi:PiT family inorganic phosphate transporter/sodium-dependent phosphate transporter